MASKPVQSRPDGSCITEGMYLAHCLEVEGNERMSIRDIITKTHKCRDEYRADFKDCLK